MNRWLPIALTTMLVGCDQNSTLGGRCSAITCKGCCDVQGVCELGMTSTSCGSNGGMCLDCQGEQCGSGTCQVRGLGGGGGGGAGGGIGATGGGVGVTHQEVLSGSRLKTINLVGEDGSRMSSTTAFYDSQLQIICAPKADTRTSWRCFPYDYFYETPSFNGGNCFIERTCQTPCLPYVPSGEGIPSDLPGYAYGMSVNGLLEYAQLKDGGWVHLSGITQPQTTAAFYSTRDGGCTYDSSAYTSFGAAMATPVPVTTFVGFSSSHD